MSMITKPVTDATGTTQNMLCAQDGSGDIATAHTNVDSNGNYVALALDASIQSLITAINSLIALLSS